MTPVALVLVLALLGGCATRTLAPVVERTPVPPPPLAVRPEPAPETPPPPVPVSAPEKDWRPETYIVKRGDTLHGIALEHGLDYRELAAMNNIANVNVIRVGQVLRVRPASDAAGGPATAALVAPPPVAESRPATPPPAKAGERGNSDNYKSSPKAVKLPFSDAAVAQLQSAGARAEGAVSGPSGPAVSAPPSAGATPLAAAPAAPIPPIASIAPAPSTALPVPAPPAVASAPPAADTGDDKVDWGWPARGRIVSGYSESASLKGIDIGGTVGIPVVASAPGRVVYAGSGLRGYGKLVIVKHNKTFLSAYAHLDQITIREGQNVGKGQELGKMGSSDSDQVKLHFEIRQLGKPVDPMRYLPRG